MVDEVRAVLKSRQCFQTMLMGYLISCATFQQEPQRGLHKSLQWVEGRQIQINCIQTCHTFNACAIVQCARKCSRITSYCVRNRTFISQQSSHSSDFCAIIYLRKFDLPTYLHQFLDHISAEHMVKDHLKKGVCHQVKLQSVSVPDQYGALLQGGHGHL